MPRGGARVGAGRPPKSDAERWLDGNAGRRPGRETKPAPMVALDVLEAPGDCSDAESAVWGELAPHAAAARTLSAGTAAAFRDLVEAIVLRRMMARRIAIDGLTYSRGHVDEAGITHVEIKAHPLLGQHRGMMQRVEAGLARFRLAPMGKEIVITGPATVKDDGFGEFDQTPQ